MMNRRRFLDLDLPVFMPDATLGTVRSLTTSQIKQTGTRMLVVNTFHLYTTIGVQDMQKLGGIKKLMGWDGRVLSDSGGYQVYSLIHRKPGCGNVTDYGAYFKSPVDGQKCLLTPEISIDMQVAMDTDAFVVLDDCRHSEIKYGEAEKSVLLTTRWAKRAKDHLCDKYPELVGRKKIFAVIHGGKFEDLRKRSAQELQEIQFDGYCFGGWPVDKEGLLEEILRYTVDLMPEGKPKYAMGVGTPDDLRKCLGYGYNMFDCVIPTRNARHGLLYTSSGEIKIKDRQYKMDESAVDSECGCETCTSYSRAYLHHLFRANEQSARTLATIHNLTYYSKIV